MVSIDIDITFFIQMGLILLLVVILNKLIFRPVLKVIDERGKKIEDLSGNADSMAKEVDEKLVSYRLKLEEAKAYGNAQRAKLKKAGMEKEAELLEVAHKESEKAIAAARERISEEKKEAIKSLKAATEELGKSVAERALGEAI